MEVEIEQYRLAIRRSAFDAKYGVGAAEKFMAAPYEGRTTADVAAGLGVTRQYVSFLYPRLSGRTWSSVLHEKGINVQGPRGGGHHPEPV